MDTTFKLSDSNASSREFGMLHYDDIKGSDESVQGAS